MLLTQNLILSLEISTETSNNLYICLKKKKEKKYIKLKESHRCVYYFVQLESRRVFLYNGFTQSDALNELPEP